MPLPSPASNKPPMPPIPKCASPCGWPSPRLAPVRQPSMAPESIVDHRARAALEFCWADGAQHVAGYQLLRSNCPCADCKALRAIPRADVEDVQPATGLRVTDILPVGAYGVQFVFSDGHDRVIFPWAFLKELLERTASSRAEGSPYRCRRAPRSRRSRRA
ncbi:gamma-butyrobetaine hydroxylase-like domain-containing protein [Variovorax sp. ZT5P49]|uniref:gamma-butyrobetaine hydroxylase-like domain-containing protein n=1 Tax=Variovorax sp. ZT5P49 TaxID=3443733 RepID=UPI003F462AE1